jgi:hypothetical protein
MNRWAGLVVCVWETEEVHTGFWWGDMMERDHLEDLNGVARIMLKWIFN